MIYAVFGPKTVKNGSPFTDFDAVHATLDPIVNSDDTLLLGGGRGLDEIALKWARANNIDHRIVAPVLGSDKESAFSRRNMEMIMEAHKVIVYWDGKFRATHDLLAEIVMLRKTSIVFPI